MSEKLEPELGDSHASRKEAGIEVTGFGGVSGAVKLVALGVFAGFLSGMFGVGGGVIIVPGLMALMGVSQRLASGTSLATIVPLASVGVISYAIHDSVSWVGALLLALGAMLGAQLGTWLLAKVRLRFLQFFFVGFILLVTVSMFVVVPVRDAVFAVSWWGAFGLVLLGVFTGTLSGLLGIGGGVIVVPALMLVFGASDLVAKGTSLLMMIPAALVGTASNLKRKIVNLKAAVAIGIPAAVTTSLGSLTANAVSPGVANILFAGFLVFVGARMSYVILKTGNRNRQK